MAEALAVFMVGRQAGFFGFMVSYPVRVEIRTEGPQSNPFPTGKGLPSALDSM